MTFKTDLGEVCYVEVQGAPLFNNSWMRYANDDVIIIDTDWQSKYLDLNASSNGMVMVGATERSLHLADGIAREDLTVLKLREPWHTWDFVGFSSGRYTITLVFCRPDWMKEKE